MQTLKISVTMGDEKNPGMELRMSSNDSDCDVVIELPTRPVAANDPSTSQSDAYVLGGYAGI
jgi:hypothetical protein